MELKFVNFVPYWYTKNQSMIVISSREFRQNQKLYFDKADQGEQVIVQRGKDKAYVLQPVSEDDLYFSAEMIKRILEGKDQLMKGESVQVNSKQELDDLLGL